ncbi:MAG TPA: hypothetical protein VGF91_00795 [Solirubrobacteraceae bacterium]
MHDDYVIAGLCPLGIPAEAIARAMRRGDPDGAIFQAVLMPAIADRTVSASEIERRGGLRVSGSERAVRQLLPVQLHWSGAMSPLRIARNR